MIQKLLNILFISFLYLRMNFADTNDNWRISIPEELEKLDDDMERFLNISYINHFRLRRKIAPIIIRGIEAHSNKFPYQVALTMRSHSNQYITCGGTLISKSWVLTAAHCLDGFVEVEIILGAHNRKNRNEASQQRFTVYPQNFVIHSDYPKILADIGLIKLPFPATINSQVKPIPLPCFNDINRNYVRNTVITSGWGQTSDASKSTASFLKYAVSKIISNDECIETYGEIINTSKIRKNNLICTKGVSDSSVCSGDSGGPLVSLNSDAKPYKVIGIASFAMVGQCAKNFPQGYTRVDTFLSWIKKITGGDIKMC